ncbi:MAG: AI-2E family transporter [Dorea sp.]|nr:AI-2E family transporter [Dorea sp.]
MTTHENKATKERQEHLVAQEKIKNSYYSQKPIFDNPGKSKFSQAIDKSLPTLLIIIGGIIFYFVLLRLPNLSEAVSKIIHVIMPVVYGCIFAYVLNPIVKLVDSRLVPFLISKNMKKTKAEQLSRALGVTLSIVFMIAVIVLLCNMLIPELYKSIRRVVILLPYQMDHYVEQISQIAIHDNSTIGNIIDTAINEGSNMLENWLRTGLLDKSNEWMRNLSEGVFSIVGVIMNLLIGLIISIYLLFGKEKFGRQAKKIVYAMLSPRNANLVLHFTTKTDEIFGGFVISKVVDSAIIGVICFFGLTILKMPYSLLVSVIVGVTNIIPFFGPYIGAVPSTILILLVSPRQGLYFVIFVLVLQQFDGNILGPKIMGNSIGLSAFWVIVAILLGGGLFGLPGMLVGVPTFAVLYYMIDLFLQNKLEKKKLPTDSDYYDPSSYVDISGEYFQGEGFVPDPVEPEIPDPMKMSILPTESIVSAVSTVNSAVTSTVKDVILKVSHAARDDEEEETSPEATEAASDSERED